MIRRRGHRRFRMRRNRFLWVSTGQLIQAPSTTTGPQWITDRVFPAGRSAYLCDVGRLKKFVVRRMDAWLTLTFQADTTQVNNPLPLYMAPYLVRTRTGSDNSPDENFDPFGAPELPSTITSWITQPESSAGTPFIWRTLIYPQQQFGNITGSSQTSNHYPVVNSGGGALDTALFDGASRIWRPTMTLRMRTPMTRIDELSLGVAFEQSAGVPPSNVCGFTLQWGMTFWGG